MYKNISETQTKIIDTDVTAEKCCKSHKVPEVCTGLCKAYKNIGRTRRLKDVGICAEHWRTIKKCTTRNKTNAGDIISVFLL